MHDGRLVDACFVHRGKKLLQRHRALLRPLRLLAADRRHRVTDGIARNDVGGYVDDLRWHAGDLEVLTGSSRSRVDEQPLVLANQPSSFTASRARDMSQTFSYGSTVFCTPSETFRSCIYRTRSSESTRSTANGLWSK